MVPPPALFIFEGGPVGVSKGRNKLVCAETSGFPASVEYQ